MKQNYQGKHTIKFYFPHFKTMLKKKSLAEFTFHYIIPVEYL